MSKKYLLKIKPLGPYTLGTDRSFVYEGINKKEETSYIINSLSVPNQTSLLGMLRFVILENKRLLKTDFNYSTEDKKKIKEAVGANSFQFADDNQEFGSIKYISPIFIISNDDYIVKTPFFYTNEEGRPEMDINTTVETEKGLISFPSKESFNYKNWYQNSYYNLDRKTIIDEEIFSSRYVAGNKITNDRNKGDGFFKVEQILMNKDYCFALEIECDEFPERTIGYMGKRRASFRIEAKEIDEFCLIDKVRNGFNTKHKWYYALSDIYLSENPKYEQFCVIEKKMINNIETNLDKEKYKDKYTKNKKLYLISSGSVFYKDKPKFEYDTKHLKNCGYNHLIEIGGQNGN